MGCIAFALGYEFEALEAPHFEGYPQGAKACGGFEASSAQIHHLSSAEPQSVAQIQCWEMDAAIAYLKAQCRA